MSMVKHNIFRKQTAAEKEAEKLGCKGTHKHEGGFMPCSSHKEWEKVTSTDKVEGEIEELVDFDGTMLSSKIPILDPHVTNKGTDTTDKTVAMSRVTQDPLNRGYRLYYGESVVKEVNMEDAFGYEETKDMDAEDTIKFLEKEFGFDEEKAEERAEEMGKTPELDDKKVDGAFTRQRLQEKEKVFTKEEILKMKEDILVDKDMESEIKPISKDISKILIRNAKALKTLARKEGVSIQQLLKYLKDEQ